MTDVYGIDPPDPCDCLRLTEQHTEADCVPEDGDQQ